MPRRRQNIGRRTRRANQAANARSNENEEQRTQRQEADRTSHARSRQNEDAEASAARHAADQMRMRQNRANLADASHIEQNLNDRLRMQASRDSASLYRAAFQYNHQIDYCSHKSAVIGTMSKVCPHCKALKFKNEPQGLCCSIGKVKLPILNAPPEPLHTLVSRITPQSRHFLNNIRRYNSCFQMTSFGATEIVKNNAANGQQFNSIFKIKFITKWAHCCQCQTNHIHFYKFTLWAVRTPRAHSLIAWMHVVATTTSIHLLPNASLASSTLY